jgi:hypothetical protein
VSSGALSVIKHLKQNQLKVFLLREFTLIAMSCLSYSLSRTSLPAGGEQGGKRTSTSNAYLSSHSQFGITIIFVRIWIYCLLGPRHFSEKLWMHSITFLSSIRCRRSLKQFIVVCWIIFYIF